MELLIYFGQVSLYAANFWAIFRLLWRDRPFLNQSRGFLLASLIIPVFLPLIRLPRPDSIQANAFQDSLPSVQLNAVSVAGRASEFSWLNALLWLYVGIALIQLTVFGIGLIQVRRKLKSGNVQHHPEYRLITKCQLGPGTLGRSIFFPTSEVDPVILEHERAHIRFGHQFDLWLLQLTRVLFWFSPAHWLLASELKALHEFQADQEARKATQTSDYMTLLVSSALGSAQPLPIAHLFSPQLLKRRIMMLQNRETVGKNALIFATMLLSAGFLSTVLFAQTTKSAVAVVADNSESKKTYGEVPAWNLRPNYGEVNIQGGAVAFKIVEESPRFNGDMHAWLQQNLHTENLKLNEKTPACVIQFVVAANGEIQSPVLQESSGIAAWDVEVLRVVKLMPAWKPGMQKGSPVAVSVSLPVYHNGAGC